VPYGHVDLTRNRLVIGACGAHGRKCIRHESTRHITKPTPLRCRLDRLFWNFRPEFLHLAHENLRLDVQAFGKQENRSNAGLSFGTLQ